MVKLNKPQEALVDFELWRKVEHNKTRQRVDKQWQGTCTSSTGCGRALIWVLHMLLIALQGKRCMLNPSMISGQYTPQQDGHPLSYLLLNDIPMRVKMPSQAGPPPMQLKRGTATSEAQVKSMRAVPNAPDGTAQLARIWVATPPPPLRFSVQPVIKFKVFLSAVSIVSSGTSKRNAMAVQCGLQLVLWLRCHHKSASFSR